MGFAAGRNISPALSKTQLKYNPEVWLWVWVLGCEMEEVEVDSVAANEEPRHGYCCKCW